MSWFYYLLFFIVVYGIYLGLSNKGVFYRDEKDIFISIIPLAIIIIVLFLSDNFGEWFLLLGTASFFGSIIYIIRDSYTVNKNLFNSISIGLAKIALSTFTVVAALVALTDHDKDARYKTGYRDTDSSWLTKLIVFASAYLMFKLINGDRIDSNEL